MKKILPLILLAIALGAAAQTPRDLMRQGNEAYAHADYPTAVKHYNQVLQSGHQSADLYYNLGNAHYRLEEYGLAILNYERALRINPRFAEARQNLDLANTKTEDEIAPLPEIFLLQWAHAVVAWFSPSGWRVLFLCLLAVLCALIVLFTLSADYLRRKWTLISGSVVAVLLLLSLACAISSSVQYNRHNSAIVTAPMAVVKSSPEPESIDKLILHEGTKVRIDETVGQWHKVRIADGNTGWLPQTEITVI